MGDNSKIGKDGISGVSGDGYSKYDAAGAPVTKHGGNDAKHDAIRSQGGTGAKVDECAPGFGK